MSDCAAVLMVNDIILMYSDCISYIHVPGEMLEDTGDDADTGGAGDWHPVYNLQQPLGEEEEPDEAPAPATNKKEVGLCHIAK